jgi:hypothetical protein
VLRQRSKLYASSKLAQAIALHLVIERAKACRRLAKDTRCKVAPCRRAYWAIDQLYADVLSLVMQADKEMRAGDNDLELTWPG